MRRKNGLLSSLAQRGEQRPEGPVRLPQRARPAPPGPRRETAPQRIAIAVENVAGHERAALAQATVARLKAVSRWSKCPSEHRFGV